MSASTESAIETTSRVWRIAGRAFVYFYLPLQSALGTVRFCYHFATKTLPPIVAQMPLVSGVFATIGQTFVMTCVAGFVASWFPLVIIGITIPLWYGRASRIFWSFGLLAVIFVLSMRGMPPQDYYGLVWPLSYFISFALTRNWWDVGYGDADLWKIAAIFFANNMALGLIAALYSDVAFPIAESDKGFFAVIGAIILLPPLAFWALKIKAKLETAAKEPL